MEDTMALSEALVDSLRDEIAELLTFVDEIDRPELAVALARLAGEVVTELGPPTYILVDRLIQEVDSGEE